MSNLNKKINFTNMALLIFHKKRHPIYDFLSEKERSQFDEKLINWADQKIVGLTIDIQGFRLTKISADYSLKILSGMTIRQLLARAKKEYAFEDKGGLNDE